MSTTADAEISSQSIEELKLSTSNFITRSLSFKRLCAYVFSICDAHKTGSINATELYAGVLLVHLNLAKYAGPAACFPASRSVVDKLFAASDDDKSGGIDAAEFEAIMVSDDNVSVNVAPSFSPNIIININNRLSPPHPFRLVSCRTMPFSLS